MAQMGIDHSSFGALLKSFRKCRRLTQQQLAESIGVHRSAVVRWEQGDFLPESKTMVLELARHLRLSDQETRHLLEASLIALAPYWSVPLLRNPFFTGREEVLEILHTHLASNQASPLTRSWALRGLGGIGKTQIALEYAYRHALEYSAVFWIGAEAEEQIVFSMVRIAEVLQLPVRDDKDQQRVVAAVKHWLTTHTQWLLIWDNVEDLALLQQFLPLSRSGTILITTRHQVLGTFAGRIDLLTMEHEEGMLFLLRRANVLKLDANSEQVCQFAERSPSQYMTAAELVSAMGGLPLALDQAGAYLEETHCGLSAYQELFNTQRTILLQQRGAGIYEHPASVSTTFTMSITATAQRHPAAWDLLQVCALLQPDAIPEELFRQGGKHLGATLSTACDDALEWDRVVGMASSYSLLSRQPETQTLSIHRLVQAILLEGMTLEEQERWVKRLMRSINAIFPEAEFVHWLQCEQCVPQAQRMVQFVEQTGKNMPEARDLFRKAGNYLLERGRYSESERFLTQALAPGEDHYRQDDQVAAKTFNTLATLYWRQEKYHQAEKLFQRSQALFEQYLGPNHPHTADILNNLALLYYAQGNYQQAETFLQRALAIYENSLEPLHPDLAQVFDNIARVLMMQGKYIQAEQWFQRALTIWESQPGATHPSMTFSLNNLGMLYVEQGKYALAEPLLQRALAIRQQSLGPDHPRTTASLCNLARLLLEQGKYDEVPQMVQQALRILEQPAGSDNFFLARALETLGILYQRQRKYEQAEPLFMRVLMMQEQLQGPDHPQTAQTLHYLAIFRQEQGNVSEAISLAKRVLSIRFQTLGEAHPQTIATQALYDRLLQEQAGFLVKEE